jgi:DNA-binding HxlR family transcriptional regulator
MSSRDRPCPVIQGMMEIGGKWKLAIIYYLLEGPKTFTDLKNLLEVNSKILSDNLKDLERKGIVMRKYRYPPLRVTYELTGKGRELKNVIEAIRVWSEKWIEKTVEERGR